MNKQSAFINEESHEKIVKENEEEKHKELKKELKRKRNCERQRAFYQRQKDLKKNEEKKKKKKVPKTNAERQREFRQRNAEKSYVDMKRRKLCSNEENVVQDSKTECKHRHINVCEYNFDPETSAREQRKLNRKSYFMNRNSKSIYDERGHMTATGKNLCDCLDESCPGCHFPCLKCNSNKCGTECRVNRKWMYEKIEIEGNDVVIKNNYKSK